MTDRSGLVVIRATRLQRERWGALARAQGRALKHWILDTLDAEVERSMMKITIPANLPFSALRLGRAEDGSVLFSRDAVKQVARASGLPVQFFLNTDENNVASLIVAWYQVHRQHGGEPNPVADDLIAEVAFEDATGQSYSLSAGRA